LKLLISAGNNLSSKSVFIALHRIGPYHHARFLAAAQHLRLQVLETRHLSAEYPWRWHPDNIYPTYRFSGHPSPEDDPPRAHLDRQINDLLAVASPTVVVTVGWADRSYQRLLLACHIRRIPLVIVSDSRQRDEPRTGVKEWIKRQLLQGYSAALVAGSESRAYLNQLGFPPGAVAEPWDVVNNAVFQAAADTAQSHRPPPLEASPHFLCVSRFVAKKNHAGLLAAYATYQRQGGRWSLRLIGAGPLETYIRQQIAQLPDPKRVQLLPFCQLEELGRLYGQASAFVLASSTDQWGLVVNEAMAAGLPCLVSSACGCAVDLIEHNRTGWCFDPSSTQAMAELMHTAERQPTAQRDAMVAAARQRLVAFTPLTFAQGLLAAVDQAISQPRFSRRAALVARLLSHRP